MRTQRSAWLVAAAVAAVAIVVEAPILLGGRTWADRGYQTEVLPARAAAAGAWAAGRLPEWWDGAGLGVPLAAEPAHGAMDPLLAAVGAAPDAAPALDLMIVLHVMLGAVGVAAWARRRAGASDLAPVVAAIAGAGIAASGALHAALLAGGLGVAWLPWVGWASEPPPDGELGLGARRARMRRALAIAALIGAAGLEGPPAVVLDATLVAIAVAAAGAIDRSVARAGAWLAWVAAACAVGAIACAAAWLPALVHRLGDVAPTGAAAPRGLELLGWLAPAGAAARHLGAVWIALAAIGVAGARRRGGAAIAAAAVVVLGLAWATAIAMTAADPSVHLAAASVVVAVLGAAGLDRLAIGLDTRAAALLGAAAVVVAGALAARHDGGVASLGELAAIAAVAIAWPRGGGAQLAAALLVVAPAFYALRDEQPLVPREALADRPVLAPRPGARVFRPVAMDPDAPDAERRARDDHATLAGEVAARAGGASAPTADPGRRAIEDDAWHAADTSGGKLFDRYSIEEAILPTTVAQIMHAPILAARGRWALVDAQAVRPRAFVARQARGAAALHAELRATFPGTDAHETPLDTIVLDGDPGAAPVPGPLAPCAYRALAPERVVVDCARAPAGWAVVGDAWAPGWTATVDGDDATVRRADTLIRAVAIDAGDHTIAWTYRTPWLRAALIATGLAWVHLALGAWLARRRRV